MAWKTCRKHPKSFLDQKQAVQIQKIAQGPLSQQTFDCIQRLCNKDLNLASRISNYYILFEYSVCAASVLQNLERQIQNVSITDHVKEEEKTWAKETYGINLTLNKPLLWN